METNYYIDDFTEDNYEKLLILAKQKYDFITYQDINKNIDNVVIWRHDIDFSVHRALKMAIIEAEHGIISTYFFYFHSCWYNLLEDEVYKIGKKIIELGHKIGLHFDPSFYNLNISETDRFIKYINIEKGLLMDLFETDVQAFSFHNPDTGGGWMTFEDFNVSGMINTYSKFLKDNFTYCSDSNGYWRYKRLECVLKGNDKKLHILLHPEWWVPNAMPPRARIERCIEGRKNKSICIYDNILREMGRVNVK